MVRERVRMRVINQSNESAGNKSGVYARGPGIFLHRNLIKPSFADLHSIGFRCGKTLNPQTFRDTLRNDIDGSRILAPIYDIYYLREYLNCLDIYPLLPFLFSVNLFEL